MTADRRRKKRVRARAAKTGESYTAALRQLRGNTEEGNTPMSDAMSETKVISISSGGHTDIGKVRSTNEDHYLIDRDLFAVADGMGGLERGDVASKLAIDTLQRSFVAEPTADGLVAAVHQANTAVRQRAEAATDTATGTETDDDVRPMGTTIAAAARIDDRLVVVNVGDSRVYLFRQGSLVKVSSDHSRVADLVRAGEIAESEAVDHPERHVLTVALGPERSVAPGVNHIRPEPGDRVLLCTDGLFNEVAESVIAETLSRSQPAEDAARQLIAEANDRGGSDNVTAVVLDIEAA